MTNPDGKLPVALIAGPTASGKTALSLRLAEHFQRQGCTIINADSAQVYAGLPILSAQPSLTEMERAPHRLFGYLDGDDSCSAARWSKDAKSEIADAHADGRLPVLVGGTGLYMRTLLDGIAPIPEVDRDLRSAIRALPTAQAWTALLAEDPAIAAKLDCNDDSRIKRALEVIRFTGQSLTVWREKKEGGIADQIDLRPVLLLPPREWLYARCDGRFLAMLDDGAEQEVAALIERQLPSDAPIMRAIGVPEISAMLAGEITREKAIILGQIATRQYAKRQYTWFRNQLPGDWPRWVEEINYNNIDDIVTLFQLL
jgi:tRNA dimethylallyltransferase